MAKPQLQVLVDWNADGDFVDSNDDITTDIRSLAIDQLRDLDSEFITGRVLDIELNNDNHLYSPPNTSGALSGNLKPGRIVWARAWYPFDTFTGSVNTALASHTPDEDANWTWVNNANTFELNGSGAARCDASGSADFIATMDFLDADVSIASFIFRATDTTDAPGLCVRYVNASNYAYVRVNDVDASNATIELRKVIGGTDTQVAISSSVPWSRSAGHYLNVVLHGTSVRVFVRRTEKIDATMDDAAINAGTKHGLFADGQNDHEWRDFGGFKSLFYGKIVKIQPRPAIGDQYCYIQAKDAFQEFNIIALRYQNSVVAPYSLAEIMSNVLSAGDFSATDRQLEQGDDQFTDDAGYQALIDNLLVTLWAIQEAEDGFVYIDGMGFVTFEDRSHRTTAPHTTSKAIYQDTYDGSNPAFVGLQWSDGVDHVENRILGRYQIGRSGVAVLVWEHEGARVSPSVVPIAQGETKEFIAETKDFDLILSVTALNITANTLADGSGTNKSSDVTMTEVNIGRVVGKHRQIRVVEDGTSAGFITRLDLTATTMTLQDPTEVEAVDSTSQTAFGERRKEINTQFITRDAEMRALVASRLARRKDPKTEITLTIRAGDKVTLHDMIQRRISDRVTVTYSDMGINQDFFIEGESWRIGLGGTMIEQLLQLRGV